MTQQYTPQEMTELEGGGYLYCYPCQEWADDAYCFGDDHSRHCGHRLKVPGELSPNMAIQCSGRVGKLWGPALRPSWPTPPTPVMPDTSDCKLAY